MMSKQEEQRAIVLGQVVAGRPAPSGKTLSLIAP